jgi:hypothetical protein
MKSAVVPLFAAVVACASFPSQGSAPTNPRLVILLVIDQWPEWSFEAKRPAFRAGFARMVSEGQRYVGRHPSAATLTAPGHALLGTGEPPVRSGIIANEWWHRDLEMSLASVQDEDGNTTVKWLRVPGLGDSVAGARRGGKAVAVSLKARAAILPLGQRGVPIWYDAKARSWTTTGATPPWLLAWNQSHPVGAREQDVWTPLSSVAALAGVDDDQPGEVGEYGFGPTFPHDPSQTAKPNEAIQAMPLGDELVLDTALAAIRGEHLGADSNPDLLVISLSAHDLIGHGWGHESREMWDAELRIDQWLGDFFQALDRLVGARRWSVIATSDHGGSPLPEKLGGGRMTYEQIQQAANNAATAVLGPGEWIESARYPNIYFSKAMLAQPQREIASAAKRVIFALQAFPGIENVDWVANVTGQCDRRAGQARALCQTFDPERSGELFYLPKPGWITQSAKEPLATSHGSLHDYDRLVPLIIFPSGSKQASASPAPLGEVDMTRVADIVRKQLGL